MQAITTSSMSLAGAELATHQKLRGEENYEAWCEQIEIVLKIKGLNGFLTKREITGRTATDIAAEDLWSRQDALTLYIINEDIQMDIQTSKFYLAGYPSISLYGYPFSQHDIQF
jgi:hypothetical protein